MQVFSKGQRGWKPEWPGWAHGQASAAQEEWLQPGRERWMAEAVGTAPRTQPQPPGARTGKSGSEASSDLSGMRALPKKGQEWETG